MRGVQLVVLLALVAAVFAGCVEGDPEETNDVGNGASPQQSASPTTTAAPTSEAAPEPQEEPEPEPEPSQDPQEQPKPSSDPGPSTEPDPPEEPEGETEEETEDPPREYPPQDIQTGDFCNSSCMFSDDQFHEFVLYNIDTKHIDVLIIPPVSPYALRDTETMRLAVQAWADGIEYFGADWFREALVIDIYILGEDIVPPEVMADPEIIVVGTEHNPALLFGIGYRVPASFCRQNELSVVDEHQHGPSGVAIMECTDGGQVCVAYNSNFLLGGSYRMQDLVAHEVGHCLTIGHVGDALDFRAANVPIQDIMSYQYNPYQVHCVSNMNIRVMEGVFSQHMGIPSSLQAGDYMTFNPEDYRYQECANPPK